jgi:hypothetical protein
MKHYITLLSLLIVSLGFAQKDPIAIIKSVNALKKQTIAQMQANTDKTKNDILYEKFAKEAEAKLLEIENVSGTYDLPEQLKPYLKIGVGFTADFQKLLDNAGLEAAWDEGFVGFYFKQGYLAKTFRNYLSEEYLLYLKFNDIRPFMYSDAALMIGSDTLGEMLLNESNFIKKYPNSRKIKEVKLCYADDVMTFIFGIDNTPEARKDMKAFVSKYPEALATPLVKLYLENTKVNKNGMTVYKDENKNLYDLINAELEKQLGGKISDLSSEYNED